MDKLASTPPGGPEHDKWRQDIMRAINNIKKELNKMGPAARQKYEQILKDLGITDLF